MDWSSNSFKFNLAEKKKVGRPIRGEKPRNQVFQIRIDEDTKSILEAEKKRTGKTMAQIVIDLVKTLDR